MRFPPRARGLSSSTRDRRRPPAAGRITAAAVRSVVEALEGRTMMSATTAGSLSGSDAMAGDGLQLRVVGTPGADHISVARTADGLVVSDGAGGSATFAGNYATLLVDGGAGNDVITIFPSVTTPAIL